MVPAAPAARSGAGTLVSGYRNTSQRAWQDRPRRRAQAHSWNALSMAASVDIETGRFRLRTLKPSDASERWRGWARDPAVMQPLNNAARAMSLDYLARYVSSFDGNNRHLIGVFDKATGLHIGFFLVE